MARTIVTCTKCGAQGHKDMMKAYSKNNRGQRVAYICPRCAQEMHSYYDENNELRGADTVHPFTYGMELETSGSTEKARGELAEYKFMPSHDSTVDVEFKSPIMNNLKSLSHLGKVLDKMLANGEIEIDSSCGTHFHVGHSKLNAETMGYVRQFYNSLFVPLCEEMQRHPMETEQLFGRNFGFWSDTINMHSDAMDHTNFINVQHNVTLEFRIAYFKSGAQYMRVAKLATKITEAVMNNFVEHFNDSEWDHSRYATIREYRLHKAQVAAQKMVKAYLKAINA